MSTSMEIVHAKAHMRTMIKKRKRLFRIAKETRTVHKKILLNTCVAAASSVFVYVSYRSEVPTHQLINTLLQQGKDVYVPKILDKKMYAVRLHKISELRASKKGIMEPVTQQMYGGKIDCMITPGLAFDSVGRRLGQGGGYYDKYFARYQDAHKHLPHIIGLCWQSQIVPRVPTEPHDTLMEHVIAL